MSYTSTLAIGSPVQPIKAISRAIDQASQLATNLINPFAAKSVDLAQKGLSRDTLAGVKFLAAA